MAAVPVTVLITSATGEVRKIEGAMYDPGLSIGGGPIIPGNGNGKPPDPGAHPEHPIYYPPIPTHPIVLPDPPPIDPPTEPPTNPPDPNWQWVWVVSTKRWEPAYVPGPTDPQPHSRP